MENFGYQKMHSLRLCLVCGDSTSLRCSGCRDAYYCGELHQKAHWKIHCSSCKPYQIQWDDDIGHHLVASRNLEAGSFILHEDLLVFSMEPSCFWEQANSSTYCLGGCDVEADHEGVSCPNCPWPTMCGDKDCWNEWSPHAMGECSLFKEAGTKLTVDKLKLLKSIVLQLTISVLRCIALKERDPLKWEKLMKMDTNFGALSYWKQKQKHDLREAVVNLVNEWMKGGKISIPRDLILKLCDVFCLLNVFPIPNQSYGPCGVYSVASRIAHSCVANVTATFNGEDQITVRAAVPILKGTKMVFTYHSTPEWTSADRHLFLKVILGTTFGTGCSCQRCKDPAELGSFISGIYCPKCPDLKGCLLPMDPKKVEYIMVCNKCKEDSSSYVWQHVEPMLRDDLIYLDEESIFDCEEFLHNYDKILHPRHSCMIETKLNLLDNYFYDEEDAPGKHNDEVLRRRVELGVELLKLADIVSPGLNRWRGRVMFHLGMVVHIMTKKQLRVLASMPDGFHPPKNLALHKMLKEAMIILSWEPEGSEEAEWSMELRRILVEKR